MSDNTYTIRQLANQFNKSKNSIRNAIKNLNLGPTGVQRGALKYNQKSFDALSSYYEELKKEKQTQFTSESGSKQYKEKTKNNSQVPAIAQLAISSLNQQLTNMQKQMDNQNDQLKAKDQQIKSLQELLAENQKIQLTDKKQKISINEKKHNQNRKKISWLRKFFS